MLKRISISTPSRLHFGLLRFHARSGPNFGGMGMMVDRPRTVVELERSDHWKVVGPSCNRAREFAERALRAWIGDEQPYLPLKLTVREAIPQHQGLGGGTQLALSVGAAVRCVLGLPPCAIDDLVAAMGRGRRSAVGSHGFDRGGLIWEGGRHAGESLGRLERRVSLPDDWRFVLTCDRSVGLSGRRERRAFESLPSPPDATTVRLRTIAEDFVLAAAENRDINAFGESVYEYGRLAGECFAAVQGGPYANEQVAARVRLFRRLGALGVGQSSWGPTVFAASASQENAEELVDRLRFELEDERFSIEIAKPDNRGASLGAIGHEDEHALDVSPRRSTTVYNNP